jgi:hypothetical protein
MMTATPVQRKAEKQIPPMVKAWVAQEQSSFALLETAGVCWVKLTCITPVPRTMASSPSSSHNLSKTPFFKTGSLVFL